MALSIIRQFTGDDADRLTAAASRFASRHRIELPLDQEPVPWRALELWLGSHDSGTWPQVKDLKRLWQGCLCRALRVEVAADIAVGSGYVGRKVR